MPQTGNFISPEVFGDMLSAGVAKSLKFKDVAVVDTTLQGRPGSKLSIPVYSFIGDAELVPAGQAIPLSQLASTYTNVTVAKIGKGVVITDEEIHYGLEGAMNEAEKQLKKAIVQKIDADSFTALTTVGAGMTVTATTVLNADAVADALVKFGEDDDEAIKILYVSSAQMAQLRKDPDFKEYQGQAVAVKGAKGEIFGCQVVVSDRITTNSDGITIDNYIVKPGALGILLKKDINVEVERVASKKSYEIYADEHFATYLRDASKAIKLVVNA